tara:strand:- start:77 stop:874 length:798 start_codon:yes stop_codon:yes gene_type:complete
MSEYTENKVSIKDLINDIRNNLKLLILYFLLLLSGSIILPMQITPIYKSDAILAINKCRNPNPLSITNISICPEIFVTAEILNSELLIRDFIDEQININADFVAVNKILSSGNANEIVKAIKEEYLIISPDTQRGLIRVSFLGQSPLETANLTNSFTKFSTNFINERKLLFIKDSIKELSNYSDKNRVNLSKQIANELYKQLELAAIVESTLERDIEIIDYAYPPDFRFKPSLRLIFVQINLIGIFALLIFYFLIKYYRVIGKEK